MNKAERLLIEYVEINRQRANLTARISTLFFECTEKQDIANGRVLGKLTPCLITHYEEAKAIRDPEERWDYVEGVIDCDICIEAQKLIEERRKLRKPLGIIKRKFTVEGKRLTKVKEENEKR